MERERGESERYLWVGGGGGGRGGMEHDEGDERRSIHTHYIIYNTHIYSHGTDRDSSSFEHFS